MGVYFSADLAILAESVGYLTELADTDTAIDVALAIEAHRDHVERRPRRAIPH
jgi:hypothetical protein